MTLRATDLSAWRCRTCKRVVYVRSDATSVKCIGDPISLKPLIPAHPAALCDPVSNEEGDPIELAKAMGLKL